MPPVTTGVAVNVASKDWNILDNTIREVKDLRTVKCHVVLETMTA